MNLFVQRVKFGRVRHLYTGTSDNLSACGRAHMDADAGTEETNLKKVTCPKCRRIVKLLMAYEEHATSQRA